MLLFFSCSLIGQFNKSLWFDYGCNLTFVPFVEAKFHLSTYNFGNPLEISLSNLRLWETLSRVLAALLTTKLSFSLFSYWAFKNVQQKLMSTSISTIPEAIKKCIFDKESMKEMEKNSVI